MQKRNDSKNQKKKFTRFYPTFPPFPLFPPYSRQNTTRHVKVRATLADTEMRPPAPARPLSAAHHLNLVNHSSGITGNHSQTLMNSRPTLIQDNLLQQDPVTARQAYPSELLLRQQGKRLQTLVNAHELSSNTHTRHPAPARPPSLPVRHIPMSCC